MRKIKFGRPKSRKTRQVNIIAAFRRRKCLELRRDGKSLQAIADQMKMSVSSVWQTIQMGLAETIRPVSEELRELELQRLDWLLEKNKKGVDKGNVESVRAAVRIIEARAKMLGLNAPERHEVSGVGGSALSLVVDTRLVVDAPKADPSPSSDNPPA